MKIENAAAFQFLMQDDIYLLTTDKKVYSEVTAPELTIETPFSGFNYLGGNRKKILVVVYYVEFEFIDEIHLTALESTIKRLGLNIDDVLFLIKAKYPVAEWKDVIDFFTPEKVLLLGKNTLPQNTTIKLNRQETLGNCKALYTFSFEEMMDNTENKKSFLGTNETILEPCAS